MDWRVVLIYTEADQQTRPNETQLLLVLHSPFSLLFPFLPSTHCCNPLFANILSTFLNIFTGGQTFIIVPPLLFPPWLLSSLDYQLPVPCSRVLPDLNFLHRTTSGSCLNMFPQNAYTFLSGLLKWIIICNSQHLF